MQKNFTQLIAHFLSAKRYTVPAGAFLLFLATSLYVLAAVGVSIIAGTGGATFPISADLAANATATTPAYSSVGDIAVTENLADDIKSTGNIILRAPAGWRFGGTTATATAGPAPGETRGNVRIAVGAVTLSMDGTQITIPITNHTSDRFERIVISNVEVQALNGTNIPGTGSVVIGVGSNTTIEGLSTAVNTPVIALSQRVGAVRKLAFVTPPSTVETGAVITPAPQVAIQDQFGNTVTAATNTVTLTRAANSSLTGVLTPGTATRTNGVVTFSGASINTAGVGYQLVASSSGLTSVTSATFTVNNRQPVITAVSGCLSAGDPATSVTITGENFLQGATVSFGGVAATDVAVTSATSITATIPSNTLTAGNKNVVVTNPTPATNNGVSAPFVKPVLALVSQTISGRTSVCANESDVNYSVSTNNDVSRYEWKVTSGGASVASITGADTRSVRLNFSSTSGEVELSLVAYNNCTKAGPASTITITVNPLPTAVITAPDGTVACVSTTLAAEPVVGATYQWYRGSTAVTAATSDNTYDAEVSGNYRVVVSYNNGTTTCSATSNTIGVTINPLPTATITQGATATYCANGSTILTTQESGTGYTYQWYVGGSPIANETARTLEVSAEGDYTVQVTRNGCSTISAATTVTELPLPTAEITPASDTEFCAGGNVVFNATPGTGYTYRWFAEGSSTVLDSDGSFSTSTPGNYYVEVTGANGCTATSASVAVVVNQPPVATITATGPTDFCAGESVTLNAPLAPVGSTYMYEWNLVGSTAVIGTGQSFEVADPGTYTVTVINTTTGCRSTSAGTVVREGTLELAIFTYTGATEFCAPGSLQLDAILPPTGQNYTYRWFNAEGTTVSDERSFSATVTGTYQVEITETLTGQNCIRTSIPIEITVNPQPTADITGGAQSLCAEADNTTTFSVSGTFSGGSALWSSSNTNFAIQDAVYNAETGVATATVVATGSGDATISLTTSSTVEGCNEAADAVVLNVKPLPIATVTPRGETTFCQGDEVILDASQGQGYTYQWYLNGDPVIGTGSSYTASLSGNYYVVVTSNDCPVQSPSVAVTVNPQPTASISTSTATTFCEGGSVVLTAVSDIGTDLVWYRNGTEVGTGATYTATESGSYTLGVSVEGTGCSNLSAATVVNVDATPDATITALGEKTFCDRESVTLQAPAAPAGQTYTYQWFNGTTQVGTNQMTYQAAVSGNYTVRVTNTSTALNCSATTATPVAVTVNPLPVASISFPDTAPTTFCQGGSLLLTGVSSTGPSSYIWYRNNVQVATGATYAATQTGSYTVRATDGNSCTGEMSAAVQITVNPTITGNSIAGAQTVCSGGAIAALTQASGTSLAGGATPYSYQWQSSANNSTWSDITTGGNAASYTPASQTVTTATTTYYRRIVRGGNCSSESASVAVTVTPLPTLSFTGAIANTSTFYTGQGAVALTASPSGGTFSGTGVTGDVSAGFTFNPCTAKAGTHVITYNYTSPDGARCSNSITKTVTVNQSTYRAVITANPHPFCRGGGGTTYTSAVYRDVQPGEIIYPYLVNANGDPVDATGALIPKGGGSYPVPNPDYPYPAGTPESIKAMAYRFFQPIVSDALAARKLDQSLFTYQWGKNDEQNRKNDLYITKDAGLSSQDYYEVEVTGSLCTSVALESNRMYSAVLESYTVALSATPNPICQGAAVTFTATLGAAFPWNVANLQLDFVLERGNVVLNPTSFTYTGSNTITFTTDAAAAGGFVNGDKVSARFSSNIESYLPSSNCIEGPASTPVTLQVNDIILVQNPAQQNPVICLGGSATFTAPVTTTGPATVTYTWTVGTRTYTRTGASGATFSVPSEVTGTAGSYPVSVVVSSTCERTTTLAVGTLTVKPALAVFTVAGGGSYCQNSPVSYPITLSGSQIGVTYTLLRGGSTTGQTLAGTGNPLSFTATSATGTYTVSASYTTAPACTVVMSGSAAIIQNPLPTVTVNSPTTCAETPVTVTAVPTGGTGPYSYTWTVPTAWTGAVPTTASFTTTVAGTYTVRVTDSKNCASSAAATSTVTVNERPTVTVTSATVCEGDAATIVATPTGGTGPYTYNWTVPQGVNQPGTDVASITTTVAGDYTVSVRDSKNCASSQPATGTVTVKQKVVATGDIFATDGEGNIITPEVGGTVTYVVRTNIGVDNSEIRSYIWETSSDGITWSPGGSNPTLVVSPVQNSDLYVRVQLTPVQEGCYTLPTIILETGKIVPLPVEILYLNASKQGNDVLLEWATASEKDNKGFEVQVSKDGLNYRLLTFVPSRNGNSNTKQVYAFPDKENGKDGTRYYRLKQLDHAGTFEFFGPKVVTFGAVASKVIAFPNPFNDEITLDIASETDGEMLVVVTDAVGKQLMQRKVRVEKGFTTEKLKLGGGLPRGLYIIKTEIGGYTQFIKMIKE